VRLRGGDTPATRAEAASAIEVFDATGRFVRSLAVVSPGVASWDGIDARGRDAGPGMYFLRAGPEGGSTRVVRLTR
jgi:hypothetical protein